MKKSLVILLIAFICSFAFAAEVTIDENHVVYFTTDYSIVGNPFDFGIAPLEETAYITSADFPANANGVTLLVQLGDGVISDYTFLPTEGGKFKLKDGFQGLFAFVNSGLKLELIVEDENAIYAKALVTVDAFNLDKAVEAASKTYKVGDEGPAGGYIYYDKGFYSDGWRYLEAAPYDTRIFSGKISCDASDKWYDFGEAKYLFGYYRLFAYGSNLYVNDTIAFNEADCSSSLIGEGANNTALFINKMTDAAYIFETGLGDTTDYAAKICEDLEYNGYDDWFLPSEAELASMYENLHLNGIGNFAQDLYWSSTEKKLDDGNGYEIVFCFAHGESDFASRGDVNRVRASRAF